MRAANIKCGVTFYGPVRSDEIVRKSDHYQIVTNFYQSKVPENKRPCEWYRRSCQKYKIAESMIKEIDTPTIAGFRDILDATHRETTFATTLYSNIYDLKEGVVHLYYLHDFENEVMFDLKEELKKGRHYYILPNLFGKDQKYDELFHCDLPCCFRKVFDTMVLDEGPG